ncbi:hypothetical protein RIF29_39455 [Crotalaria pallida]|uniref:Uncharacterized protein n=1 Tax=Crotalaria pallida TaxID=3830 RepID=A0AAN9E6M7_CROPI
MERVLVVVDRYPTWYKAMESSSPPLLEVPLILQLLEVPWWQLKITESDSSVQNLNKGERMRRMASSSGFLTLIRYFSLDNLLMEHVTLRCWYELISGASFNVVVFKIQFESDLR